MADTFKLSVLMACRQLLRPIVLFLLKSGITWREFSEVSKSAYVDVATAEFGIRGRPTNASRVAILTGLGRREVAKQREMLEATEQREPTYLNSATRVLAGWHQDADYLDGDGRPREIPAAGPPPSFEDLCKRYGGDIPYSALLKELRAVGAVSRGDDAAIRAFSRVYIPLQLDPAKVLRAGSVLQDIGKTVVHDLLVKPRAETALRAPRHQRSHREEARGCVPRIPRGRRPGLPGAPRRMAVAPRSHRRRNQRRPGHAPGRRRLSPAIRSPSRNTVMKSLHRTLAVSLMSSLLLLAAACGGGGGGSTGGGTGGGGGDGGGGTSGIDGGGFARGTISGFGSVIVNGVHFSTTSASISIDGRSGASETELKVGQVVEIRGTFDSNGTSGTATTITYNDNAEGPVAAIDVAAGTLVVLGQTVRINGATVFDDRIAGAALTGIAVGNVLEISGFRNAAGEIVATRIEPKAAGGTYELTGTVSALDTTASRFTIAGTVVNYAGVTPTNGTLTNGGCAEAKGTAFAGGALTATSVEVKSCTLTGATNEVGEFEGLITRFASATDFDVGGQRVTTTGTTTYENGVVGDLRAGLKVEAEGNFNSSGVLVARKVQIKPDTSLRLLGTIDSLDAATSTLRVFGLAITSTVGTAYEDKSSADIRQFKFADLRTGDYVEVRGYGGTTANSLVAARIERDDVDARRELQGVAASPATAPNLTILGISVSTAGAQYRNSDGTACRRRVLRRRGQPPGEGARQLERRVVQRHRSRTRKFLIAFPPSPVRESCSMNKNYHPSLVARGATFVIAALIGVTASAGIDGGGRTRGAITAFGSIFVNDVEYFLDGSLIRVNGALTTEGALRVGQVVTVDGVVNPDLVTGQAATVDFDSDLRGRITAIDKATTTLRVLDQLVRVNGATSFDESLQPANLGALALGQVVEVSGYRNSAGDVVATRVDRTSSASDRIIGSIGSLDTANSRFTIQGLTVDYSGATHVEGPLAVGTLVEVEGARALSTTLLATKVESRPSNLGGDVNSGASLEGYITKPLSSGRFSINGQVVIVTTATQFLKGTRAELRLDQKVEAEGRLDATGAIVAETVKFKYDDQADVEALITQVDTVRKTVTALGLTLKIPNDARLADKSDTRLKRLRIADLRVGDTVDVQGDVLRDPRTVRVTRLERRNPDGRTRLHARVTDLGTDQFRLVGLPVFISPSTVIKESTGRVITRARFTAIAANRDVHVRGTFDGTWFNAVEITLEQ